MPLHGLQSLEYEAAGQVSSSAKLPSSLDALFNVFKDEGECRKLSLQLRP